MGAHWRNLANTIEPSICGCDPSVLSNYFDHLVTHYCMVRSLQDASYSNKILVCYFAT